MCVDSHSYYFYTDQLYASQYNADIPFEKKAASGFYDTTEEQARITSAPVGQSLRRLDNKRKPEEEEAERKKRQRKAAGKEGSEGSGHQTNFVAARDAQIQKLKEAESIGRRRKLVLPSAQVGEAELEDIVKIGQASESAKGLVAGGSEASGRLLGDYEGLENARMARTPRTTPQREKYFICSSSLKLTLNRRQCVIGSAQPSKHVYGTDTITRRREHTPACWSCGWDRFRRCYTTASSRVHTKSARYSTWWRF
jgi:pre-mRNA-splicing factor CDC5/CEF1